MDLISRQAAIDALVAETIYTEEELREYYEANSHRNEWVNGIYEAVEAIKQLPPASNSEFPNSSDTISRAKAIEALDKRFDSIPMEQTSEILMLRKDLRELPSALSTNLAEVGTDCISRQAAIDALDEQIAQCNKAIKSFVLSMKDEYAVKVEKASLVAYKEQLEAIPAVQPERTCVNCGRTANNGGWYADGRTRCPIEEHYALPKDGHCHLWEKRNVTDDDYPERREE